MVQPAMHAVKAVVSFLLARLQPEIVHFVLPVLQYLFCVLLLFPLFSSFASLLCCAVMFCLVTTL